MTKTICDICKERSADKNFKVKQMKEVHKKGFFTYDWVEIDICPVCYKKLLDSVKSNTQNTICEYFMSYKFSDGEEKHVCYGTKNALRCFCEGYVSKCTHFPEKRNK